MPSCHSRSLRGGLSAAVSARPSCRQAWVGGAGSSAVSVPNPSPVPSPVRDCRASSWRAAVFSAGGDGDVNPLDLSLADGAVVGRITKVAVAPVDTPWMWTLAYGYHEDRNPTHGYEPTREAAMVAFLRAGDGNRPAPAPGAALSARSERSG